MKTSTTTTTKVRGVERPTAAINPLLHATQNGSTGPLMNYALVTNQDEQHFVEDQFQRDYNDDDNNNDGPTGGWRGQLLQWVHWKPIQLTLLMLLLLDVLILFVEVFLMSLFPACSIIERDAIPCCPATTDKYYDSDYHKGGDGDGYDDHHRWLGGGGDGGAHAYCDAQPELHLEPAYQYTATCDDHKWHTVHAIEEVFFALTIFILSMFMLELNIEMICLSPCVFFRQFFYLFDYIIISTSLSLELCFFFLHYDTKTSVVGLLVIARVWRFVRIGHGIVGITTEVNHERFRKLLVYTEQLEEILQKERLDFPVRPSSIQDASSSADDQQQQQQSQRYSKTMSNSSSRSSSFLVPGLAPKPGSSEREKQQQALDRTDGTSSRLSDQSSTNNDRITVTDIADDDDEEDSYLEEYEC